MTRARRLGIWTIVSHWRSKLGLFRRAKKTADVEERNATVTQSSESFFEVLGLDGVASSAGENVTIEGALGVPAIWAAVNFISGTLAGLPLHVYRKTEAGRERVNNPLATILHDAVNDETSSFEWRKWYFEQVLTGGRGLTFIERNAAGRVKDLWGIDPKSVAVKRVSGAKKYEYTENGIKRVYSARDVIDLPFMLKSDGITHRSPIMANKDAVGLAIAVTQYGGKFFANGGVPPFAVTGDFKSERSLERAADDLAGAVRKASKEKRLALTLPKGLDIKTIGADAEKAQLIEVQRFCVEQVARIFSLPPTFLQDLTHGTFSNTEQQDLHFVKHTLKRWAEQFEQELNLKLFGRSNVSMYVELNMDGLLRGDFKTRMDGYATAVQNGIMTPDEVRLAENRQAAPGGNQLFIQGATVPITQAGEQGGTDAE